MLAQYWVWLAGGLLLAFLEIAVPGYVFLGFAIGAAATGAVLWALGPEAGLAQSVPMLLLVFAILSLLAWLGLRRVLGVQRGQVKTFDRDINDD
jgi:membrane protein implicated in regulation of membrane protease activity